MYFLCSSFSENLDEPARGGSANDRIVYDDNPLAAYVVLDGVELYEDHLFPLFLGRCDKGSANVLVLDQTHGVGDARRAGESDRGTKTGIGNANDYIGGDAGFAGQNLTHPDAGFKNVDIVHDGVRAGKVDIFENTVLAGGFFAEVERKNAVVVYDDDFARFDIPDQVAAHGVDRAGFARENPSVGEFSEAQRPDTVRVTGADEGFFGHDREGKRPADELDRVGKGFFKAFFIVFRNEFDDYFGVARGGKGRSGFLEEFLHRFGVYQASVMGYREGSQF